jgi:hypothetical protein
MIKLYDILKEEMDDMNKQTDPAELLETMKTYLKEMKKVDPRGYSDWIRRIEMFKESFEKDLKQAVRWASMKP